MPLGSVENTAFHFELKRWFREYLDDLKVKENEFVQEIIDEDHMWVKGRRLEFLEGIRKEWREAILPFVEYVNKYKGTPYKYLGNIVKETFVVPVLRKIKKVENEIAGWNEPGYDGARLTGDDIDRARDQECSQYLDIKQSDYDKDWALCFFHQEKTPSFCVYKDTNQYHCFGCGEHGDVIDLVKKMYGMDFPTAIKFILKK